VALFRALSEIGRGVGVVALEPVAKAYLDEELVREGAELAADCADIDFMRQMLETRRDALLARYKRRLDMTVTASMKVAAGASPQIVEEICRTFA
jgi:flagellar motor component MotA